MLDPKQFEQAFRDWAGNILPALSPKRWTIDGKDITRLWQRWRTRHPYGERFCDSGRTGARAEKVHDKQ